MAILTTDACVIGDRVLLTHPDPHYHISEFNPAVGTKYEQVGIITYICGYSISVTWASGSSNVYKDGELSLAWESFEPKTGIVVDMWDEM